MTDRNPFNKEEEGPVVLHPQAIMQMQVNAWVAKVNEHNATALAMLFQMPDGRTSGTCMLEGYPKRHMVAALINAAINTLQENPKYGGDLKHAAHLCREAMKKIHNDIKNHPEPKISSPAAGTNIIKPS